MDKQFGTAFIQFPGTIPTGGLYFGMGLAAKAGEEAAKLCSGKALVIAGKTIHRANSDSSILNSLIEHGFSYSIFDEVEPEPSLETMERVADMAKSGEFACVIGVGGGSVLDTAKMAALAGKNKMSAHAVFDNVSRLSGSLPLILLSTTSGTGSEVSPYIVASDNGKKLFIGSPHAYADVAIVDPLLTVSMPARTTAFTGLDALSHGIEGAMGKTNPYTLAMAARCAKLVFEYLPRAVKNGNDLDARYHMSYASVLGMLAYTQGGGLYAHSFSYILAERCHIPHGAGCGLALPYTVGFCRDNIPEVMEILQDASGMDGIEALKELVREVGAPVTLSELGIQGEEIPELAKNLIARYPRALNPRHMTVEDAAELMGEMI